jgi:hypothetical protein
MPRYKLRTLLILLAVGPPFLAGLVYVPQIIWDGGYDLSVQFANQTGKAIDRIEAAAVGKREYADLHVAYPDVEPPNWRSVTLDGKGVGQIYVRSSGHVSQFTGIELSYYQEKAIVIRVDFTDGSRSLFAVNTPERGKRHIDVDIPAPE